MSRNISSVQISSVLDLSTDLQHVPDAVLIVLERELMLMPQPPSGERRDGPLATVADHFSISHAWLGLVRMDMLRRGLLLDRAAEACMVRLQAWIAVAPKLALRRRRADTTWVDLNISAKVAADAQVLDTAGQISGGAADAILALIQRRSRSEILTAFPALAHVIEPIEADAILFGPNRPMPDRLVEAIQSLSTFVHQLERAKHTDLIIEPVEDPTNIEINRCVSPNSTLLST